ncbi:MAG TPA: hypothetical protein VLG11_02425 [Candidatus Saccharimonadales bacterium]|nr:hypothetical protein [Candidatus Saccharimonadales bacterium]
MNPHEQRLAANTPPDVWAYWGAAALAGDEVTPYPAAGDSRRWGVPFFGEQGVMHGQPVIDLRAGELTKRTQEMYSSNDPDVKQRFKQLSERVAHWTFVVGGFKGLASKEWRSFMPFAPQTFIKPDAVGKLHVTFPLGNDVAFPIESGAESIMNFGPGLTAATQASILLGHAKTMECVSAGMGAEYVNSWIGINVRSMRAGIENFRRAGTLQGMISPQFKAAHVQMPEVRCFSDGIAARLSPLAKKARYDVMLLSSVHSAGVGECHAAVRGAAKYLREGGLFVLKAPNVSLGEEAGMDRVAEYAAERLGEPVAQGPCGQLQQHIDPELPIERGASFAIYQKQ